ncbi:hypothetical protein GCM10027429_12920 [Marivirga atlantica]|jgi:hypothetical protein|uniref:Uncharacterized protein n=1 Tax=Marivirga atlantica TaxID=1548457 RepID=A0A937A789_9BACT|nr:hypothetical protein [Marivirga atlantica]MBL0764905.1 hypothetical protein [Marivirga atlantica]
MAIDKDTVVDLLNYLITDNSGLSWKMGTGYHNGVDISIYEVLIYEIKSHKTLARIAFNGYSGQVVNSTFLKNSAKSEQVIDLLLDLSNSLKEGERKSA